MKYLGQFYLLGFLFLMANSVIAADKPPSYSRQVQPFLARYCLECHSGDKPKGGLNMETYKSLQEGGKSGPVLVPSKPDQSRIVLLPEGKAKPHMPPKKAKQPRPEEVAVLRAWIAAGAKEDKAGPSVTIPDIKPRRLVVAPVAALAYHPNGKILAAAGYREVTILDVAGGEVIGTLPGQVGAVTALAFSGDGRYLAVAGFVPGSAGELRFYPVSPAGLPDPKPVHVLAAHKDSILNMAWAPDNKTLAT